MHRRTWFCLLGIVLLAGVGMLFFLKVHPEPSYQGKTAAEWFKNFREAKPNHMRTQAFPPELLVVLKRAGLTNYPTSTQFLDEGSFLHDAATDGLRALGTNAAVHLAREIRRGDSRWNLWYRNAFGKSPSVFRHVLPKPPAPRYEAQLDAALALSSLGLDSRPAIPILIAGLGDSGCRNACIEALRRTSFDPASVDPILEDLSRRRQFGEAAQIMTRLRLHTTTAARLWGEVLLTTTQRTATGLLVSALPTRKASVLELRDFGPKAAVAVHALGQALKDSDSEVRQGAANALESLGPLAAAASADLIATLQGQDQELRYLSTRALCGIGTNSPVVLPTLSQLTNDDNAMVQTVARRGLQHLSPHEKPKH